MSRYDEQGNSSHTSAGGGSWGTTDDRRALRGRVAEGCRHKALKRKRRSGSHVCNSAWQLEGLWTRPHIGQGHPVCGTLPSAATRVEPRCDTPPMCSNARPGISRPDLIHPPSGWPCPSGCNTRRLVRNVSWRITRKQSMSTNPNVQELLPYLLPSFLPSSALASLCLYCIPSFLHSLLPSLIHLHDYLPTYFRA